MTAPDTYDQRIARVQKEANKAIEQGHPGRDAFSNYKLGAMTAELRAACDEAHLWHEEAKGLQKFIERHLYDPQPA